MAKKAKGFVANAINDIIKMLLEKNGMKEVEEAIKKEINKHMASKGLKKLIEMKTKKYIIHALTDDDIYYEMNDEIMDNLLPFIKKTIRRQFERGQ